MAGVHSDTGRAKSVVIPAAQGLFLYSGAMKEIQFPMVTDLVGYLRMKCYRTITFKIASGWW